MGKKNIVQTSIFNMNDVFFIFITSHFPFLTFPLIHIFTFTTRISKMNNYIWSDFAFEFVFEW